VVYQVVVVGGVMEARKPYEIDFVVTGTSVVGIVRVVGIVIIGLDPGSGEGADGRDEGTSTIRRGVCLWGIPHGDVIITRGKRGEGRGRSVNRRRITFAGLLLVVREGQRLDVS
jgi:hypothetical protein